MRYVECAADGVGQCVYCAAACVAECDAGIVGSQTEVLLECVSLENKFKTYTLYFTLSAPTQIAFMMRVSDEQARTFV